MMMRGCRTIGRWEGQHTGMGGRGRKSILIARRKSDQSSFCFILKCWSSTVHELNAKKSYLRSCGWSLRDPLITGNSLSPKNGSFCTDSADGSGGKSSGSRFRNRRRRTKIKRCSAGSGRGSSFFIDGEVLSTRSSAFALGRSSDSRGGGARLSLDQLQVKLVFMNASIHIKLVTRFDCKM